MEWAIVVGGGLNALGVVRSLGSAGVRVAVMSKGASSLPMRSRFARRCVGRVDYEKLPERLVDLANDLGGRPVLFLTEEEAVHVVSRARDELAPLLRLRFGSHDAMLALTHKDGVQQLVDRHGLPIPGACRLREAADLTQLDALRYPCVLKPGFKHAGYGARFKKAYIVLTPAEARVLFDQISPVLPDLIAQEWIEGGDDAIYFCLQYIGENGQAVASFAGRKLRAWPPQVGGTASCIAAPEVDEELGALTEGFFSAVGFRGMGAMEYKRDTRDGRFYVVEPTVGRTDFQQEVATINGNNLPYAAYCYECGLPVLAPRPMPPTIWREPVTDRWSQQVQGTHPAFAEHKVVDAYWRPSDPAPWLRVMWSRVWQRLARAKPRSRQ